MSISYIRSLFIEGVVRMGSLLGQGFGACQEDVLKKVTVAALGSLALTAIWFAARQGISSSSPPSPSISNTTEDEAIQNWRGPIMRHLQNAAEAIQALTETRPIDYKAHEPFMSQYPKFGQQAIQFAIDNLRGQPSRSVNKTYTTWKCLKIHLQPVNVQITYLRVLLYEVHYHNLLDVLTTHPNNPWDKEEVLQAADPCMQIAYAISCLTLEDLPAFTLQYKGTDKERTYAQNLASEDSYQFTTFLDCPSIYNSFRHGRCCPKGVPDYPKKIPEAHAERFYQKGTLQYSWRQLYNDYCDRISSFVTEEDLCKECDYLAKSARKDEQMGLFGHPVCHDRWEQGSHEDRTKMHQGD